MLTGILAFLQSFPALLGGINNFVNKYYDSKVQITMSQLQCDKDKAIAYLNALATVDAQRIGFLNAVAHSPVLLMIVAGFAAPFIFYINKVVVWDICLGWGSTPSIKDANIVQWGNTVLIGIFGVGGVMATGQAVKTYVLGQKQ